MRMPPAPAVCTQVIGGENVGWLHPPLSANVPSIIGLDAPGVLGSYLKGLGETARGLRRIRWLVWPGRTDFYGERRPRHGGAAADERPTRERRWRRGILDASVRNDKDKNKLRLNVVTSKWGLGTGGFRAGKLQICHLHKF